MLRVRQSFAEQFFRVRVVTEETRSRDRKIYEGRDFQLPGFGGMEEQEALPQFGESKPEPIRKGPRIGRNAPCPCGSGKKYKHCCGRNA